VRLYSRNGNDFTKRFAKIAACVSQIKADSVVLDGEAVAVDEQGNYKEAKNRNSEPTRRNSLLFQNGFLLVEYFKIICSV
jgi:ATP-dependent DNA ligase